MRKRRNIQRVCADPGTPTFLRQVNEGSKHSIVQSGNKLMKQIYPQSCCRGSLSCGSVLPQRWRVHLLPLHGSKMAVINPVGCGQEGGTLIPVGRAAMLTPLWVMGGPTHCSQSHALFSSSMTPRLWALCSTTQRQNTHQINYSSMVWTPLQSSVNFVCLFLRLLSQLLQSLYIIRAKTHFFSQKHGCIESCGFTETKSCQSQSTVCFYFTFCIEQLIID